MTFDVILKQNEDTSFWTSCYSFNGDYLGELQYVHSPEMCSGAKGCAIHNRPSEHPLNCATMVWRDGKDMFVPVLERICEHKIGHPDHDSAEYLKSIGRGKWNIHTCDGCCA